MKIPSLLSFAVANLFSLKSIAWILILAFFYLTLTLFVLNYRFTIDTLTGSFPFAIKMKIFLSLYEGLFTAFSPIDTWITIFGSLLTGINIVLIAKTIHVLDNTGKLKLSVGGATLVGLVATGCSSCGFSLLSVVGLGSVLSLLPFHGLELHFFSVILLFFSAYYMLIKLRDGLYCATK